MIGFNDPITQMIRNAPSGSSLLIESADEYNSAIEHLESLYGSLKIKEIRPAEYKVTTEDGKFIVLKKRYVNNDIPDETI